MSESLMSKKIKAKDRAPKKVPEEENPFIKIIRFSGWFFLILLGFFLGIWVFFDTLLEIIELTLDASSFTIIIFLGTSGALSFGLATKIKNNELLTRQFFIDWIVGEFIFCMFAIFSVAIYQF